MGTQSECDWYLGKNFPLIGVNIFLSCLINIGKEVGFLESIGNFVTLNQDFSLAQTFNIKTDYTSGIKIIYMI